MATRIVRDNRRRELGRIQGLVASEVEATARRIAERAQESIRSGTKTGTIYPSGHQASAPGEAPADDSGDLADSIEAVVSSSGPLRTVWQVKLGEPYGEGLEFGTPFIAPRPFLTPAQATETGVFLRLLRAIGIK